MIVATDISSMGIRELSRIMDIPLSTYYYRSKKRGVKRIDPHTEEGILDIASHRVTYGYRRVWAMLRNTGIKVNPKTVRRVLKSHNLSLPPTRHKHRTRSRDLFRANAPDQLVQTDITYIPTARGMSYLMCIKDCFSKEWLGYSYSRSCMARDAISSVEDASLRSWDGSVPEGIILRVDNGPQYIAHSFQNSMRMLGISLEYIQKHTPEDNGDIESFHNSIKTDYIWPYDFQDYEEARRQVEFAFQDYNTERPHSSIMYLPPAEFRKRWDSDEAFRVEYMRFLEKEKTRKKKRNGRLKEVEVNGS